MKLFESDYALQRCKFSLLWSEIGMGLQFSKALRKLKVENARVYCNQGKLTYFVRPTLCSLSVFVKFRGLTA